jgi:uroporphyrinogen-III synthase
MLSKSGKAKNSGIKKNNMEPTFFIGREISSETKNWLNRQQVIFEKYPLIQIEFTNPDLSVVSAIKNNRQFVVSSNQSAKWLAENYLAVGFSEHDAVFCLSEKQKQTLFFTKKVFVSKEQNAASLAKLVLAQNNTETVVSLHGNKTLDVFSTEIERFGLPFYTLEVYKNVPVNSKIEGEFNVYLFFSPSAVQSFVEGGNEIPDSSKIVAIGPTTAKTCRRFFGNRIFISEKQEELAVVKYAVQIQKQPEFQI